MKKKNENQNIYLGNYLIKIKQIIWGILIKIK